MTPTLIKLLMAAIFSATLSYGLAQENNDFQKWENEVRNLENMPVSLSENTILFTGSSSVRLWNGVEDDMFPYQAIARGYGGAKLSDFVYYANRITGPHQCGAIAVFVANDITGNPDDITPARALELFKKTLKEIRKSHPETPVFWIEITPTPSRWKSWDQINHANHLIRQHCEKNKNLYFIPTSQCFLNEQSLPDKKYFVSDMLHLNTEGYQLWSSCIKETFDVIIPQLKSAR